MHIVLGVCVNQYGRFIVLFHTFFHSTPLHPRTNHGSYRPSLVAGGGPATTLPRDQGGDRRQPP